MLNLVAVALGGSVGALARYGLNKWVMGTAGASVALYFPLGILIANVLGSCLMGVLYVWLVERSGASEELRLALTVGLLGAFTTFSTFAIDTVVLIEAGQVLKAVANVALNVGLCVGGCWLGLLAGRAF